jgi:hypothetical protein
LLRDNRLETREKREDIWEKRQRWEVAGKKITNCWERKGGEGGCGRKEN